MTSFILANGKEMLPETFHFLGLGWWVVHIVAIVAVFYIGYMFGKKGAAKSAEETPPEPSEAQTE
ncbi:MAG TPA: hypothetical protein HPP83_07145 [Candidatus Hydrogenedentes bacterium]|nr:hypothetical protein [Candidatus Hydrogenedentota bacterium]